MDKVDINNLEFIGKVTDINHQRQQAISVEIYTDGNRLYYFDFTKSLITLSYLENQRITFPTLLGDLKKVICNFNRTKNLNKLLNGSFKQT